MTDRDEGENNEKKSSGALERLGALAGFILILGFVVRGCVAGTLEMQQERRKRPPQNLIPGPILKDKVIRGQSPSPSPAGEARDEAASAGETPARQYGRHLPRLSPAREHELFELLVGRPLLDLGQAMSVYSPDDFAAIRFDVLTSTFRLQPQGPVSVLPALQTRYAMLYHVSPTVTRLIVDDLVREGLLYEIDRTEDFHFTGREGRSLHVSDAGIRAVEQATLAAGEMETSPAGDASANQPATQVETEGDAVAETDTPVYLTHRPYTNAPFDWTPYVTPGSIGKPFDDSIYAEILGHELSLVFLRDTADPQSRRQLILISSLLILSVIEETNMWEEPISCRYVTPYLCQSCRAPPTLMATALQALQKHGFLYSIPRTGDELRFLGRNSETFHVTRKARNLIEAFELRVAEANELDLDQIHSSMSKIAEIDFGEESNKTLSLLVTQGGPLSPLSGVVDDLTEYVLRANVE